MSGGSDTVTQSNFPEWAVPTAQRFLGQAEQVANIPYNPYSGQTVAQLNPYQTGAFDAIAQRAYTGSPVTSAASQGLTDTLSGKYLSEGNPYLTGQIDAAQGDVLRNYTNNILPRIDTLNARSGSFGNAGIQQYEQNTQKDLVDSLGRISTDMRYRNYGDERNRQLQATSMAPTIANQDYLDAEQLLRAGQGYQTQEQLNMDDAYRRFKEAQDYPKEQLGTLGKALGLNYGSTSTVPGNNGVAQGLGTALALYGGYKGLSSSGSGK